MRKWISVKDNLPEDDKVVHITTLVFGERFLKFAFYEYENWFTVQD